MAIPGHSSHSKTILVKAKTPLGVRYARDLEALALVSNGSNRRNSTEATNSLEM